MKSSLLSISGKSQRRKFSHYLLWKCFRLGFHNTKLFFAHGPLVQSRKVSAHYSFTSLLTTDSTNRDMCMQFNSSIPRWSLASHWKKLNSTIVQIWRKIILKNLSWKSEDRKERKMETTGSLFCSVHTYIVVCISNKNVSLLFTSILHVYIILLGAAREEKLEEISAKDETLRSSTWHAFSDWKEKEKKFTEYHKK